MFERQRSDEKFSVQSLAVSKFRQKIVFAIQRDKMAIEAGKKVMRPRGVSSMLTPLNCLRHGKHHERITTMRGETESSQNTVAILCFFPHENSSDIFLLSSWNFSLSFSPVDEIIVVITP